ncbi:MAG TPA: RecQ family ATP-dependent DNA helicase [Mycobacterium sp.]|nr:RecQ family ATP-dependent DNA helicase [Mycobacterium sp.]HUH68688.1 RecQ family ATP-dependent DNA helicase [Mycobacterium sp.]
MALHPHRAEPTNRLADELGAQLSDPPLDLFAEELVPVPAKGVELVPRPPDPPASSAPPPAASFEVCRSPGLSSLPFVVRVRSERLKTVTIGFEGAALAVLRRALGPSVQFREGQLEAIEALVEQRSRLLVVQRTGWGKSAVYFVATRLLRDRGAGTTIIVSPLLALMRDQIEAACRLHLNAVTINSSNTDDWVGIEQDLLSGKVDLLLVSPERFNNVDFRDRLLEPLTRSAGLLVVDEAHCISDWGHDFRPDYRRLVRVLELMPQGIPVLCTTATANNRVVEDVRQQLGADVKVIRGGLDRESLSLHSIRIPSIVERLAWLAQWIPRMPGSGIVYCLTVADTARVADWLNAKGIPAAAYSGETDSERRPEIEQQLKENELKVVAATSALGMGFDKPDLAFVIHLQSPDSPVTYYQQVGRAGRAVDHAEVVLLWSERDEDIWQFFLETGLPVQWHAEQVIDYLEDVANWVGQRDIEEHVNMPSSRITGLLKVLHVEGAVEKDRSKYRRTLRPWSFDSARIERVRDARLAEHQAMRDYATTSGCRMAFLRDVLDDNDVNPCGRCDNCTGERYDAGTDPSLVGQALAFIRRRPITIEPRRVWVGHRSGRIGNPLEPGRALCYLTDPGWGDELLDAKRSRRLVSDELVEAAAALVTDWLPGFDGTVVYVPSLDPTRTLVPNFAARLAELLHLPLSDCLVKVRMNAPQKLMENSAQQLRNVSDVFQIRGDTPSGPVLLVDDVADSRWTMTVLGDLLMAAGSAPIYPFTVARTKG